MILIFTSENDLSTIEVAKKLKYYNKEFYIINPEEKIFVFEYIDNSGIYFFHKKLNKTINFLNANSCWWRRTGLGINNFIDVNDKSKMFYSDNIDFNELAYGKKSIINSELISLKEYIFKKIFFNSKINLGSPMLFGLNRLEIIDLASEIGLNTPYYEVIGTTKRINMSNKLKESFVSKAIDNGIYHIINGVSYYSYTELQNKSNYINKNINLFPSLVMNLIDKKFEIRTFFIEDNFYSMAIFSQSNDQTVVDYRKYSTIKPNRNEPFKLPFEIEIKLKALFKKIGLNTGSIDLIVDKNDDYIFLEINPIGQYGMTSEPCNYNLDDVIAKYLIYGTVS